MNCESRLKHFRIFQYPFSPSTMDLDQNNHAVQESLISHNQENIPKRQKKKPIFRKPIFWIAVIIVVLVLVTIISLVLYSNIYEDEDEKHFTSSPTNKTCTFTGFLNLTDPCLRDLWIKNEKTFQDRITNVYEKSPSLQYYFTGAIVEYNSINESESAIITLEFSSPSKTSEYFISTELVTGIMRQDIYDLEPSACQNSNTLLDAFQVTSLSL